MSKFLACTLCLAVLASACEPAETPAEITAEPEEVSDEPELLEPEEEFEAVRETTVASSDSVLVDDTGYGFAYDASNVLDQDYSTSWCRGKVSAEDGPFAGGLQITFAEPMGGKTFGIMPGYARDEKIYYQNNRVKELVLLTGSSPIAGENEVVYALDDTYEMQFFQLPEDEDENVTFFVRDVYAGSKYDDTCIAEIDFWSDYVEAQDAEAAYDFYIENKEAYAKRPVGINRLGLVFADEHYDITPDDVTSTCGAVDYTYITKNVSEDGSFMYVWKDDGDGSITSDNDSTEYLGSYSNSDGTEWTAIAGMTPVLSAQLNDWARDGDQFEVKWIQTSFIMGAIEPRLIRQETITAKTCSDGAIFISDYPEGTLVGGYDIEIYYQGKLVGKTHVSLAQ